jgi:transcriptional regulator with XRE-family HTH domain
MVNERLRRARTSRGEALPDLAARIGVREGVLRAIEDGRFDLLPPGIYARAAIRSYSSALGLDPAEILDACAPSLPAVEEPISAIGRLRGVRTAAIETPAPTRGTVPAPPAGSAKPDWRLAAASAVDACVVGTLLLALIAIARIATAAPIATLGRSGAMSFAMMGSILALSYFAWFGGLSGSTAGARALGLARAFDPAPITLDELMRRALRAATDDLRFVAESGTWIGGAFRGRDCPEAPEECRAGILND